MPNERLDLLFQKLLDQTISKEEQTELFNLMADPASEAHVHQLLQQEWSGFTPGKKALTSKESKELSSTLLRGIKPTRRRWLFSARAAASLLLILTAAATIYYIANRHEAVSYAGKQMNQVATQPGSKTRLQLSDGTQVWLHSDSRLEYDNEHFGKANREVTLYGEAYFDVVKNSEIPFVIHTGQINITVRGTAFNVKAYPNDKAIETTLIRGLIEITTVQDPDRKILLKPNEKISIPVVSGLPHVSEPQQDTGRALFSITRLKHAEQPPAEVAWIQDQLVFDNEPLSSIAPKMESWYNINIQFGDDEVKKKHFTGTIERETLKETLEAMQLSFPFEYEIVNNVLHIKSK